MRKISQFSLTIEDLSKEKMLNDGDIFIPESDYGLAEISFSKEKREYIVKEIPMYGGNPNVYTFKTPEEVIKEIFSWT